MLLPSRALRSNLITLVWPIVPVWNPITFFLSSELGSSQLAKTWQYTMPGPSPWKVCAPGKETKVGQAPLGFPIMFKGNQGGFSCLVNGWQEFWSSNMRETYRLGSIMVYFWANCKIESGARWSTSCVVSAHRNCIVLHRAGAVLQGNAWPACSAPRFSLFS